MRTKCNTFLLALSAACLGGTWAVSPAPADGFDRRYLALDQTLHGSFTNAQVVLGQASNAQKLDLVNAPWKVANDVRARPISSVFVDHNGDYRMYYSVVGTHDGDNFATTAVATSSDGYDWTLPELNGASHLVDHPDANTISLPSHPDMGSNGPGGGTVFMDPSAPTGQRYKLIWTTGSKAFGAVSEDGVNFSTSFELFEHRNEHVVSAFYDTMKNEYAMYGRIRGPSAWNDHGGTIVDDQRRGAAGHFTSGNFLNTWDDVGNTVLDPEDIWDYTDGWTPGDDGGNTGVRPDFYNPGVFEYHGQYIGLPTTYYRDADRVSHQRPDRFFGTGPQYPTMMHSLDGVDFTLADDTKEIGHPFFDPTPNERINPHPDSPFTDPDLATDRGHPDAANWSPWTHDDQNIPEVGQIHAAPGYLQVSEEKMLFYYFSRPDTHYLGWGGDLLPGGDSEHSQWVAELRTDGFASIRADAGQTGQWHTPTLTMPHRAEGLMVNANVAQLQVEVLDSGGSVLSGFSLTDSVPFSGDAVSAPMTWNGSQIDNLAGQDVQLRFHVTGGDIYSFWFPLGAAQMFRTGFDDGYSLGNLDGQDGWTTNGATQGSWQVIVPSGNQPAAPEGTQYLAITKVANEGSPRAYHDLLQGGGTTEDPFTFEARLAYSDIDPQGSDGIFLGAYLNDDTNSNGVIFGFKEIGGEIHLAYRDGNDFLSLGEAEENTFYHFLVSVTPDGAATTYDIVVQDLLGNVLDEASGAASRNGLGQFSLLQLAVGTGDYGGTLYVDGINMIPEPHSVLLLGLGGLLGLATLRRL